MNARKTAQLQQVLTSLHQRWGQAALRPLSALPNQQNTPAIPTGFAELDDLLGIGGIPCQHLTALIGLPTSGLTTLAYRIMASSQQSAGIVVYLDISQTFDPDYARTCGVQFEALLVIRPPDWGQAVELLRDLVSLTGSGLLVFDSGVGQPHHVADWKLLADTLHRISTILLTSRWTLLTLLPRELPDGAAVRLSIRREDWLSDQWEVYGYRARITVLKNRFAKLQDSILLDIVLEEDLG